MSRVNDKNEKWISKTEAARRLGICERQVVRRVRDGTYKSKYVSCERVEKLMVLLGKGRNAVKDDIAKDDVNPVSPMTAMSRVKNDSVDCRKIILVDDAPEFSSEMERILKQGQNNGILAIVRVDNIKDCIEKIKSEKPCLVISEIGLLNGGSGFEMAKEKEETEEIKDIPIVWVSFLKESLSVERGLSFKSVIGFFPKPLIGRSLTRFTDFINHFLKTQKGEVYVAERRNTKKN